MRRKLYRHVRILVKQLHQFVERSRRLRSERSLVEVVEDIVDEHRCRDGSKWELHHVFLRLLSRFYAQFLLMVEESLARCEEDIVDVRVNHIVERAIALHAHLLVRAVRSDDVHKCLRQFVAVLLVHPTLHVLHNLRVLKAVYLVPSPAVVAVRREVAAVVHTFERHAEVVALRVERIPRMFNGVATVLIRRCDVDVQTTHAHMTVAREVKVAVGTERREHLVARRVDWCA